MVHLINGLHNCGHLVFCHSNTKPFFVRTTFDHYNFEHNRYFDPHCMRQKALLVGGSAAGLSSKAYLGDLIHVLPSNAFNLGEPFFDEKFESSPIMTSLPFDRWGVVKFASPSLD